jgi:hypothetical protein
VNCVICGIRKPRRHCPGVHGDICTVCCGREREESIDCPLDCVYLHDAHLHERPPEPDPDALPNQDIEATEEFLQANELMLALLGTALYQGALEAPGCTDYDVREGIEALIRTYRTLKAGLYYESVPVNTFAAVVVSSVQNKLDDFRKREMEATGSTSIRDTVVLGVLAFLQRLEYHRNNGRKRSRAFIDFLSEMYEAVGETEYGEDALEPDEPRVIL